MAGAKISLSANFSPLDKLFEGVENIPDDMTDLFNQIGILLVDSTGQRFLTSVGPDGKAWEPSQRAIKSGGNTLLKAGHLLQSLTYISDRNSVEIGSNIIYAAIHQFGGDIKKKERSQDLFFRQNKKTGKVGNRFVKKSRSNFAQKATVGAHSITMPARPYLGLDDNDNNNIIDIVGDYIRDTIQAST